MLLQATSHEWVDTVLADFDAFLLDRLLVASIVEARGHERFQLAADHVEDEPLRAFYSAIARSEARHYELFLELAHQYFDAETISPRLQVLLEAEAEIVKGLPMVAALH